MKERKKNRFNDTDFIVFNKEYTKEELQRDKLFGENLSESQVKEEETYNLSRKDDE